MLVANATRSDRVNDVHRVAMKIRVALALLLFAASAAAAHAQTTLDIRLAEERPAPGLIEATVSHSDKKVYLHDCR